MRFWPRMFRAIDRITVRQTPSACHIAAVPSSHHLALRTCSPDKTGTAPFGSLLVKKQSASRCSHLTPSDPFSCNLLKNITQPPHTFRAHSVLARDAPPADDTQRSSRARNVCPSPLRFSILTVAATFGFSLLNFLHDYPQRLRHTIKRSCSSLLSCPQVR